MVNLQMRQEIQQIPPAKQKRANGTWPVGAPVPLEQRRGDPRHIGCQMHMGLHSVDRMSLSEFRKLKIEEPRKAANLLASAYQDKAELLEMPDEKRLHLVERGIRLLHLEIKKRPRMTLKFGDGPIYEGESDAIYMKGALEHDAAKLAYKAGYYEKAIEYLEAAIKRKEGGPDYYGLQSWRLSFREKIHEKLSENIHQIEVIIQQIDGKMQLGPDEQWKKPALAAYNKAELHATAGYFAFLLGDYGKAVEHYEAAIGIDQNSAPIIGDKLKIARERASEQTKTVGKSD
jgi:tetratricopeptide (TPR) repeat protein